MVQFRRHDNAHWYHETQRSGSLEITAAQVNDEGDSVTENTAIYSHKSEQGNFLLGLNDAIRTTLLDNLRQHSTVLSASETLYQTLFPPTVELSSDNQFSLYDRLSSALTVAQVTGVQRLCSHYAARLTPLSSPDASRESNMRLTQMTQYARQLASQPTLIDKHALQQLSDVGLTEADIIVLTQIIGFVGYQARVIAGISALAGYPTVILPGFPRMEDASASLLSTKGLHWQGWLPTLAANDGIAAEQQSYEKLLTLHDLLARHPASLSSYTLIAQQKTLQQTAADWSALVSLVSARINGSNYCQAHYKQQLSTSSTTDYSAVTNAIDTDIACALAIKSGDPFTQPLIHLAAELTRTPERFSQQFITPLILIGFSDQQLLGIIISTAAAGWTNRLRQALGEVV